MSRVTVLIVALLVAVAPASAQERTKQLTIDQLQSVTSLIGGGDALWSPDGSKILFVGALDGGFWTINPEGGFPTRLASDVVGGGSRGNAQLQWAPDGRSIGYVKGAGEGNELFLFNVADGTSRRLTSLSARVRSYSFSPDSRTIAFANDRYGSEDIWVVSIADGQTRRLTNDARYEGFPSWTPDGSKILYTRLDDDWVDHDVFEMPAAGGTPRLVVSDKNYFDYRQGASFGFTRVSPDGKTLFFRSQRSGWANYWSLPLAGGEPKQIAAEQADQSDGRWSPDGSQFLFLSMTNGTRSLKAVAAAGGTARTLVTPKMGMAGRAEWSPDSRRISYTLGTPTSAEDLYVIAATGGEPKRITTSEPATTLASELVTPEKVSWTNEGQTINGYLFRPKNLRAGERVPLIMLVHGGPTGQFSDNYQLQQQFFASRGYAVLTPNVRGSSGYGKKFEDANNRDWGHGDLRDVIAGVEMMKKEPYINPDRVGITGVSYGGMLTMYAVGFAPPNFFQAAISGSGYGDVTEFHTKVLVLQHMKLLNYELGKWPSTPEVDSIYRRSSSILKAKYTTVPTMLIHGYGLDEYDTYSPALEFAKVLDQNSKVFRYKKYPNETYYVYGKENTKQMLKDMLVFFDQFLKDDLNTSPESIARRTPE